MVPGSVVGLSEKRWAHAGILFHDVSSNLSQMELRFL